MEYAEAKSKRTSVFQEWSKDLHTISAPGISSSNLQINHLQHVGFTEFAIRF